MTKEIPLHPFPCGPETDGFFAALASALVPCLKITEDKPYWCNPKGSYCINCGMCGDASNITKNRVMLYHTLITASGVAFTFDYPEDDTVPYHTMPNVNTPWRWEEPFIAQLMDFAGFTYERKYNKTVKEMYGDIKKAIDAGYTAMVANHGVWATELEWISCWSVVYGYTDDGICVMKYGGEKVTLTDGQFEDWIVITGQKKCTQTYFDILQRIYNILSHPSHDKLEKEIYNDLDNVTDENAVQLAYKLVVGINGVPIETRWHAAEAFISIDNLLYPLTDNMEIKNKLKDLFFEYYINDNSTGTHITGWKIWGALKIGTETNYMPIPESFELIKKTEVQKELKRLFKIVFDNDRIIAGELIKILNNKS